MKQGNKCVLVIGFCFTRGLDKRDANESSIGCIKLLLLSLNATADNKCICPNVRKMRSVLTLRRPLLQAEILATCQENINGMNAMLRGPTVTVLSPRRCQEMRGKRRIKMFVVIVAADQANNGTVEIKNPAEPQQQPRPLQSNVNADHRKVTTTKIAPVYANPAPTELCKCAQLKRTLTAFGRRVAMAATSVPESSLSSLSLGRDMIGNRRGSGSSGRSSSVGGYWRDQAISRFIFYAKVTILTELFSFLRGCRFSISSIGS